MKNLGKEVDNSGVEVFTDGEDKLKEKRSGGRLERGRRYLVGLYFKHKKREGSYQNV